MKFSTPKTSPALLIIAGVAALWWISQRRAGAAVIGNPAYGTEAAIRAQASRDYLIRTNTPAPAPAATNPLQTLLSAGLALMAPARPSGVPPMVAGVGTAPTYGYASDDLYGGHNNASAIKAATAYGQGGPSTGVYGVPAPAPTGGHGYASEDLYGSSSGWGYASDNLYGEQNNFDAVIASPVSGLHYDAPAGDWLDTPI